MKVTDEELFEAAMGEAKDGRFPAAMALLQELLLRDRSNARAWNNLGIVRSKLGDPFGALVSYDQAIACDYGYADARNNRGVAFMDLDRPDLALAALEDAVATEPAHYHAHINRGNALSLLGRRREARESYCAALAIQPDQPNAHFGAALCALALGDYENGWREFEWRWKTGTVGQRISTHKTWRGEDAGRTGLLLYGEQGFGDVLQFMRYAPVVKQRWPRLKVYLEVRPSLARLAGTLRGIDGVVPIGTSLPPGVTHTAALMSLPHIMSTTVETIPAKVPYLWANPDAVDVWRRSLGQVTGLKVGLCWAGASRPNQPGAEAINRRRSMTLAAFAPLAGKATFVSLMDARNPAAREASSPPAGMRILDTSEGLDDFYDTAALVGALDLVIAVDTAIVHLAGALGKPVWLLSRFDACWRWLEGRKESPWYPTLRHFQQPKPGDWASVVREIAAALDELARNQSYPDLRKAG